MNIVSFSAQTTRKNYWRDPDYVLWFIKSICFFNLAVVINYFATRLATKNAGGYVDDLFFNILPRIDTSFIDKYGALLLYFFTFALIVIYQKRGPFLINCLALLIIIRAFFINLTYLGVPEGTTQTQNFFTQGGDLFFSGHTALPFMIALVFWDSDSPPAHPALPPGGL